jgi:hypothetical protein
VGVSQLFRCISHSFVISIILLFIGNSKVTCRRVDSARQILPGLRAWGLVNSEKVASCPPHSHNERERAATAAATAITASLLRIERRRGARREQRRQRQQQPSILSSLVLWLTLRGACCCYFCCCQPLLVEGRALSISLSDLFFIDRQPLLLPVPECTHNSCII